ncbi:Protein of unknown function DUF2229, CoA enzyme activase [Desulfurispirillum indicum S5]|uniref:CoA-substrate-specific enzyme activase n=1 Tax=Desulfurispirillum indicum (strain ATCC BAA-1389 / DSM 22839 / S5) TaxID=653733 RepID=E6W1N5_DESIS|nr:CoA activase [Desulfurispirillum indicum]ADU66584.1 Protein of unknown function DUF2229, CoA enzyme activase [Desulfurispirillum indicum S5]
MEQQPEPRVFFDNLRSVARFDVSAKTLLIPDMEPFGARLLAASFRAFGVNARVMETYTGLALGKEFTSGKECFPCQVTLGDVLHHLEGERKRLGEDFRAEEYVYFMPEADGPCRFGMYNKMQRLVLDRFPHFRDVPILYLSTKDGYSSSGILPDGRTKSFRKLAYMATIIADILGRITWRTRPYEQEPGSVNTWITRGLQSMEQLIEQRGADLDLDALRQEVARIARGAAELMDRTLERRPRIGIVGEIYIRSHPESNRDVIAQLEYFGAEVVNASLGEWVQFVSYETTLNHRKSLRDSWKTRRLSQVPRYLKRWLLGEVEKRYLARRQHQLYASALQHLDIQRDHSVDEVRHLVEGQGLFDFAIGTEAPLSIGGALEYIAAGFNGVVNLYPFTCMPSTVASSILKPMLHDRHVPYLDISCDDSTPPGREVALQTFMYQARQHHARQLQQTQGNSANAQ